MSVDDLIRELRKLTAAERSAVLQHLLELEKQEAAQMLHETAESVTPAKSAAGIINELSKLTEAERRAVRRKLSELAAENEDVALSNQSATEAAMMFDRMEDEDARRKSR